MKLKIILLLTFIALNLVVYISTSNNVQARIDKALEYHSKKLESNYNTYKYEQSITAKNLLAFTETFLIKDLKQINNASQSELADLRKKILQKIESIYSRMKNKGLYQVQFVFPDNRSFLRVHKPSAFGDNLSKVRYSFKYVNETKKSIEGFEVGRVQHGYRYVNPVYDKEGNYICAVETSFSTNHLQDYFTNIMKLHTHYLIQKNVFDDKKWKTDEEELLYKPSAENPDYMLEITKYHSIERCIKENENNLLEYRDEIINSMKKEKSFNLYVKCNNGHSIIDNSENNKSLENIKVLSFKPINSVHGKVLSWIVAYEEDPFIASTLENATKIRIILFILFLFVFYFIYRTLNQQQQLKKLQSELTQTNETLKNSLKDVQEKVEKAVDESRQKDTLLIQQSKMASMGEMIGNIAHQWRQPLNALGLTVQKIKMYHEEDMLTEKEIDKAVDKSKKLIEKMSATIDDFRNFFKVDKVARKFIVNEAIDSTLELLEGSFKNNNISVFKEYQKEKIELLGHKNELEQVLLNLINNAKDALLQNHIKDAKIDIKLESTPQEIVINIVDNAGGIPSDIMDKIFDPYFTTKEQGKGTGIGLYMSKMIIETNMNGKLKVQNINDGASFIIKIPKEEEV